MQPLGPVGKIAIWTYLLLWFVGSLWLMALLGSSTITGKWLGINFDIYRVYTSCGFAGALGGSLYALRLFHEHYETMSGKWLFWYAMRPILCFGSAIVTIVLFESGILLLKVGDSMAARVSVAFLTGYGYGKFMEKLRALTETFFNGENSGSGNGTDLDRK